MPIRCTAIEAAEARGWTKAELKRRTGLSLSTIYNLQRGTYRPGGKVVDAIMRAFPDLPYERLFVPDYSKIVRVSETESEAPAA
jgi:transcriptional regulator with XRE-family HTH domain